MAEETKKTRGRKKGTISIRKTAEIKTVLIQVKKLSYTDLQQLSAMITEKLEQDKAEQIATLEKQLKELKGK